MMMKSAIIFCVASLALCALASAEVDESKLEDTFQPKDAYRFDDEDDKILEEYVTLSNQCSDGSITACGAAQLQLIRLELIRLQGALNPHNIIFSIGSGAFNKMEDYKNNIKRKSYQ
ncbi:uncharacterized protein LOC143452301 [Clavelina lepadiformis]|uniref:uncharacterized protein LOC143452301 n=1 Tax=Clavelina lepadiformis TaxID=159417 RepID=UPI004041E919